MAGWDKPDEYVSIEESLWADEHRYEYRDGTGDDAKVLAEYDDAAAQGTVLRTLIEDGHPYIKAWVDGKPTLGSYGDYGRPE